MKPSAVVFDLGKVLLDFDYVIAARRLDEEAGVGVEAMRRAIEGSPAHERFERGLWDEAAFLEAVRQDTGYQGTPESFARAFGDIFDPIVEMVAWQASLAARGVPTFIFSNTNALAIEHVRRQYPFFSGFRGYVYSFEHQAMKPESALYEAVESLANLSGPSLLYVDDRPENVAAGAARGWMSVLHERPSETIRAGRAVLGE